MCSGESFIKKVARSVGDNEYEEILTVMLQLSKNVNCCVGVRLLNVSPGRHELLEQIKRRILCYVCNDC